MKPWITVFLIGTIGAFSIVGALAQDTKLKPPGSDISIESMSRQLRIQVEWIELSHKDFTALLEEDDLTKPKVPKSSNDGPLRKKLKEMVEEGEAQILDTAIVMARSGQRATVESIQEVIYPTEYIQPELVKTDEKEDGSGADDKVTTLPIASAYETRNVGTTLEVEPILGADERTIDLNLSPEIVYHVGEEEYGVYKEGESELVAKMPLFYTMKVTTQVTMIDGEYCFIGVQSPFQMEFGKSDRERKVMVFVKTDILLVGLPQKKEKK